MAIAVRVPTPLRRFTNSQAEVMATGSTVAEVLADLDRQYPGIKGGVCDEQGKIKRFVNVYVNEEDVKFSGGENTAVKDGDQISIIPAMAGGAGPVLMTPEQVQRYQRHIIMPEVGRRGQIKLMQAKVLLVGAGGLGSPTALYLAAAGVGTLGIVDMDVVDLSNLQRQILHRVADLGRPKVDSAADTIKAMNPNVNVVKHNAQLSSENAFAIIEPYDVIVNGCDNFPTRYLVNDACVMKNKILVDGSIFRFEGQATVFEPGKGCYRCLFPTPPPPGEVPSCAEAGVLGVLPGIVGCIQAIETIKLILGIGETLAGRLLLFDALTMDFRQMKIRRDPACPVCGDHPTITEPIDYDQFCGAPPLVGSAAH